MAQSLLRLRLKVVAEGLHHVPATGPVVIASHHYHHLYDGVILLAMVPMPLHLVVGLDWIPAGLARNGMLALCRLAEWPVILRPDALLRQRGQDAEIFRAQLRRGWRESLAILDAEGALVVFPEGYPTIDPHPNPKHGHMVVSNFRVGFAELASHAAARLGRDIPVVPVGFSYRPGRRWQVRVAFGPPYVVTSTSPRAEIVESVESTVRALAGVATRPSTGGERWTQT